MPYLSPGFVPRKTVSIDCGQSEDSQMSRDKDTSRILPLVSGQLTWNHSHYEVTE